MAARTFWRKALRKLYAITKLDVDSPYYYYGSSQSTGGEPGIATGFGNLTLVYVRKLHATSYTQAIVRAKTDFTSSGWAHLVDGTGIWGQYGTVLGTKYLLTAQDVGRALILITRITAVAGNLETLVNRMPLASVAISSYTPNAGNQHLISNSESGRRSDAVDYIASLDFRGVPTVAQLQTLCDTILQTGNVPASFAGGTVTHRQSLLDALAGTTVVDGQAAPATLNDTITAAASDQLVRSNAGITVREISVSEGRHQLGLTFAGEAQSYLVAPAGAGGILGAATGMTFICALRMFPTATGFIVNTYNVGASQGYCFYVSGDSVRFYGIGFGEVVFGTSAEVAEAGMVCVTWNGTIWSGYIGGRLINQWTAPFTYNTAGSQMCVGQATASNTASPVRDVTIYGLAGADQAITQAEYLAVYNNWKQSGRISMPAGKTNPHVWDFGLDCLNVTAPNYVPVTCLDRAGASNLTRVGGWRVRNGGLVSGDTASGDTTGVYARTSGSSFPGLASSPWYVEGLWDESAFPASSVEYLANQAPFGVGTGWALLSYGGPNDIRITFGTTTGQVGLTYAGPFAAGKHHCAAVWTGNQMLFYVDGVLRGSSATGLVFSPVTSEPLLVGTNRAANPVYKLNGSKAVLGLAVGTGAPSAAQIATAASTSISLGQIQGISGITTKRWDYASDIVEAGGYVPPVLKERVSGMDPMTVFDLALAPARRAERAFGWSDQPTLIGARNWSGTNYYSGPCTGFANNAYLPYWFIVAFIVTQKAGGAFQSMFARCPSTGTSGTNLYAGGTNNTIYFTHGLGSGTAAGPTYSVLDSDIGKPLLIGYQWTGSAVQGFAKRAKLGSDIAASVYAPYAGNLYWARNPETTTNPCSDNISLLGIMGGSSILSLAEFQSTYDDFFANNDLMPIAGKTTRLFSARRASLSGQLPTSIVDAMGSGEALAITGSPTVSNFYAHAA